MNDNVTISAFPPPPPFYKLYIHYHPPSTTDTVSGTVVPQSTNSSTSTSSLTTSPILKSNDTGILPPPLLTGVTSSGHHSPMLPPTLPAPLPPPLPPKPGSTYKQFGQVYTTTDVIPSLEEQGKTQLYPMGDIEPIKELKRLNRSMLFNYLQLLETLIENPSDYQTKIEDITLIYINFHHLLNSYRPHQARENIISIMLEQIKQKNTSIEKLKSTIQQCKQSLSQSLNQMVNDNSQPKLTPDNTTTTSEQQQQASQNNNPFSPPPIGSTNILHTSSQHQPPLHQQPPCSSTSQLPKDHWVKDYLQTLSSIQR